MFESMRGNLDGRSNCVQLVKALATEIGTWLDIWHKVKLRLYIFNIEYFPICKPFITELYSFFSYFALLITCDVLAIMSVKFKKKNTFF